MPVPAPHRAEREALCDLMLSLGPHAPTLCQGWNTIDLAAHLVIRERNLTAAPGIIFGGPFSAILRRATERTIQRPYPELVAMIRSGPPLWLRPFDRAMNLMEFYVHHEDVRRGSGDITPRPESETLELDDALWRLLCQRGRLLTRSLGAVGLNLLRSNEGICDEHLVRKGTPTATLSGAPGELILYMMGRREAAQVTVDGSPEAIRAISTASFGI